MTCDAAARLPRRDGPALLSRGWLALCLAALVVAMGRGPCAMAQPSERPSLAYGAVFSRFHEGEYRDALDGFRGESGGAVQTPQARWIDSICYETMIGECYYHMGRLNEALDHYTAAIRLYVAYSDWMIRVRFRPTVQPSGAAVRIPWGAKTRRSRLGHYPKSTPVLIGQIDHNKTVQQGGVAWHAQLVPVRVQEIVRCTTLAIRRRWELMGPASQHSELTGQLVAALSRRPGPPNHWSEAWIDLQLAMALLANGKPTQALPHLERSVVISGEFDHPMTSTALLELGRLAMGRASYPAALKFFEEAGYSAAHYADYGVLEEAFRLGTLAHMRANRKAIYPRLAPATRWARVERLSQLQASLLLMAAENYAVLGKTREAAAHLDQAQLAIGRRDMGAGRMGGRLNFLRALTHFQAKRIDDGNEALAAAMEYMKSGSRWMFQISLADGLYVDGPLAQTPRVAMELYKDVLRDPQPNDWIADPMEALAVLVTPHAGPMEHWFDVAMRRKEHEAALQITDRAKRHRFFSSLAFGGRLQSLRWILEGPTATLDKPAQLHRQGLRANYPALEQLARQGQAIRTDLKAASLVADNQATLKKQSRKLNELADVAKQQEALLREIAVRREPAGLVFPPLTTAADVQKALPDGHAVLAFFSTRQGLYGFLLNNKKYANWKIGSPEVVRKKTVELLRNMGHYQQNHELSLADLKDARWKQSARQLLELITRGSRVDLSQKAEELAIVPDGLLWYVPFEALQVEVDGRLRPLITRYRIRYAPTVSLAVPTGRHQRPTGDTAVVVGRLFPRDDEAVAQAAYRRIADVVPGTVALKSPMPATSDVYATLFDRLVVLDDLDLGDNGPYAWSPVPIDRGKPGNSLGDWLRLPLAGPDEIILPGYHTPAEESLKRLDRETAGEEMFLSVCGLMSSGARTLLLSRWRTGGQSSFDLVREFTQEMSHTSPADAWQRAVFLTAGSRLNLAAEPRVKHSVNDESPKANHPFFWSGYALIDSGTAPKPPPGQPDAAQPGAAQPDAALPRQAIPNQPRPQPRNPAVPEPPPR